MAKRRNQVPPTVQERLREVAAELRQVLYGEAGCPEWGTKFTQIEADGMSVGLELARLLMEQSVNEQASRMPEAAGDMPGDIVQPAGTQHAEVETEAGSVEWEEPRGYLKKGRKAFFPSAKGVGDEGR